MWYTIVGIIRDTGYIIVIANYHNCDRPAYNHDNYVESVMVGKRNEYYGLILGLIQRRCFKRVRLCTQT